MNFYEIFQFLFHKDCFAMKYTMIKNNVVLTSATHLVMPIPLLLGTIVCLTFHSNTHFRMKGHSRGKWHFKTGEKKGKHIFTRKEWFMLATQPVLDTINQLNEVQFFNQYLLSSYHMVSCALASKFLCWTAQNTSLVS